MHAHSVAQSCLTLCDPMDCSPPGSSIHGIFQARVLEWGAIAFSAPAWQADALPSEPPGKTQVKVKSLSRVRLFATPWTVAYQSPQSMEFSRQEYWSVLPCLPPGDLPDPGIKPTSLMSPPLAGGLFTTSATWEAQLRPQASLISPLSSPASSPSRMYPSWIACPSVLSPSSASKEPGLR